jgi:transposase
MPKSDIKYKYMEKERFKGGLPVLNLNAAGIDIGATQYDVAIIKEGTDYHSVKQFGTFTKDLIQLVEYLKFNNVTTVAIESTGIYWINLYSLLEKEGIEPYLVNAKHVKNVTGRKKDDTDAIWLQKLHACGLLQKSFQLDSVFHTLRTYVRHREKTLQIGADSVRRMQKALELMNVKIHNVISDILGKTGIEIIQAILQGVRNPEDFLKHKNPRIQASDQDIIDSLNGIWNEEYIFLLQQSYDAYCFSQKQVHECDEKIEKTLIHIYAKVKDGDISNIESSRKKSVGKNQFYFNARKIMHGIVGVDLCKIDGLNEMSVVKLISEIGIDMKKWKSASNFAAWMNLVPNTKITGGKIISSRMQKKKNHAGLILRMASSNLSKSKSPLGDYARRMRSRIGGKGAVVASAHKMSKIVYHLINNQVEFNSSLIIEDQISWKQRQIVTLEKRLDKLKQSA